MTTDSFWAAAFKCSPAQALQRYWLEVIVNSSIDNIKLTTEFLAVILARPEAPMLASSLSAHSVGRPCNASISQLGTRPRRQRFSFRRSPSARLVWSAARGTNVICLERRDETRDCSHVTWCSLVRWASVDRHPLSTQSSRCTYPRSALLTYYISRLE